MPPQPTPTTLVDVPLPLQGLDVASSYSRPNPGTTPSAVNVRGFDAQSGRRRLSRRQGTTKLISFPVNGGRAVQELAAMVSTEYVAGQGRVLPGSGATILTGAAVVGNKATAAVSLVVGSATLKTFGGAPPSEAMAGACTDGTSFYALTVTAASQAVNIYCFSLAGTLKWQRSGVTTVARNNDSRTFTIQGLVNQGPKSYGVAAPVVIGTNLYFDVEGRGVFRLATATGANVGAQPWFSTAAIQAQCLQALSSTVLVNYFDTGTVQGLSGGLLAVGLNCLSGTVGATTGQPCGTDAGIAIINTTTGAIVPVTGLQSGLFIVSATRPSAFVPTAYPNIVTDGTSFYVHVGNFGNLGFNAVGLVSSGGVKGWTANVADAFTEGYGTSTGSIYVSGSAANLALSPVSGGTVGVGVGVGVIGIFDVGNGQFFTETATALNLFNADLTLAWTAGGSLTGLMTGVSGGIRATGGTAVGSAGFLMNYNRAVTLVAVAGGAVRVGYGGNWTTPTSGTGALSANAPVIRSAALSGFLYFADGVNWKLYNPVANAIQTWIASSGALPTDIGGNAFRLIETWRGRLVGSGLPLDSRNWFMSAVGDATNWNYLPSPSVETQAVAGNNAPAGLLGDVVTALIPYNDDVLIFGGDHTIWQMTGDPMAGGRLDLVSDITGMAWGRAWCKSPNGTVYFFGSRGAVYTMAPGSVPLRISQAVDPLLSAVNVANVNVRMAYDERWQGVHVFLTPLAGGATTHYYYDEVTAAWWSDSFTNNAHNPFAVLAFDGDDAASRFVALGGQDGFVRVYSATVTGDDGTAISSSVLCGPLMSGGRGSKSAGMVIRLQDLQCTLAGTEGSVGWAVQRGDYAEQAALASAFYSGTFSAGRAHAQPVRVAGQAAYVALSRNALEAGWSVETLHVTMAVLGKSRQRIFG